MYFSLIMKEEPSLREVYVGLLKGDKNVLVDSGVSYNYPDIVQLAAEADLCLSDIDVVVLTHCHADHAGGLYRLKQENPNLRILTHPLCRPMVEDINAQYQKRPVPAYFFLMGSSVSTDQVLEDGEVIDIGYEVKVIHTPGHSEDSLSLYVPEEKLLLSGDAVPNIHDLPIYEDLPALNSSLAKLKGLSAEYVISSFCGLWDHNKCENLFVVTQKHIENIQRAVEEFQRDHPKGSLEEMGRFVLQRIGVEGFPIPIFLASLKEHIKKPG